MKFTRVAKLLSIFILSFASSPLVATTYIVGTCRAGHQFPSIGVALDAVSAPDTTVLICPGNYPEQLWITKGVNLRGISTSASSPVVISPPAFGLLSNDVTANLTPLAAQLRASDAAGPVNISDITLDGAGKFTQSELAGLYFRNSSGTINHVTVRNFVNSFYAAGIWMEGGTSNPTVTVENSSVYNFRDNGIQAGGNATFEPPPFKATIKNNFVSTIKTGGC